MPRIATRAAIYCVALGALVACTKPRASAPLAPSPVAVPAPVETAQPSRQLVRRGRIGVQVTSLAAASERLERSANGFGAQVTRAINPSGIAVVDVPSMTFLSEIPTDGFIACGMIMSDADHVVIASSGSGGHIYTLDMTAESLTDRGVVGAASWHSFVMTPDGARGFGSSPLSDEVVVIDLTTTPVTRLASIRFDQTPGVGSNQPDAFGGGEPIYGNVLPVGLRAAGNVAVVNAHNLELRSIVNLASPAPFNPMTCGPVGAPTGPGGCAVHGVTPRPRR